MENANIPVLVADKADTAGLDASTAALVRSDASVSSTPRGPTTTAYAATRVRTNGGSSGSSSMPASIGVVTTGNGSGPSGRCRTA